jgi:hypothetical protein
MDEEKGRIGEGTDELSVSNAKNNPNQNNGFSNENMYTQQ